MSAYRKNFDKNKYVPFIIKDDEFLEKYNEIWEKVKRNSKENFIVTLCTIKKSKS